MIKAAGAVAWRPGPDGEPEILLVHRKKYDDWSLPKGKTEPGETLPVTAVREVREEGGVQLALGRRLASVRYSVGGRPKRVHYWAARVLSVDADAVPNAEVDEVAWLRAGRAVEKVSYTHDHGVLADFAARPAGTVPLILLRHAKALDKRGWKRSDGQRPLADAGQADARTLADLLACFAPRPRLISSTAVRCLDTLRPLAQLTGERVREEPSLYIHDKPSGTEAADPAADLAAMVREIIVAGEPAVLCAHRENIPALREAALAALAGHPGNSGGPAGEPDRAGSDGTGSAGTGSAGTGSNGTGPDGAGSDEAGLDGSGSGGGRAGLAARPELPKEWDDPLPTAGFWVLNIAPLPGTGSPAAGEPATEASFTAGPAAAGSEVDSRAAAASQAGARRWWQRWRGRGRSHASRTTQAATVSAAPPPARAARSRADGTGADGPVGVLVSADRYDLSDS
jgi:8-oxo-dGTP diphosphatase